MFQTPSDLSPKLQLIFFRGYLQALQDLSYESVDRTFKVLAHLDTLNSEIAAEETPKQTA